MIIEYLKFDMRNDIEKLKVVDSQSRKIG